MGQISPNSMIIGLGNGQVKIYETKTAEEKGQVITDQKVIAYSYLD